MDDRHVFSSGSLRGHSIKGGNPSDVFGGIFDIAIMVPSWDQRSICVAKAGVLRARLGIVLVFKHRDTKGLRDAHDAAVLKFAEANTDRFVVVHGDSLDLHTTWSKLLAEIVSFWRTERRPLTIQIDASACPRYYLLAVVASTLRSGVASRVSVTYAEGRYPEKTSEDADDISFTGGHWKATAIPGLEGSYSPGRKRFMLVSIGFEGWKTMRTVTRADPDRVSVLHGDPGTEAQYAQRAMKDNQPLIDHYQIPSQQILKAPAADAIAAWKTLTVSAVERPDDENSYFLCSGTKPHSIALALRAMCLASPAVLYNLPEAHHVVPIEPNGSYWRFEIDSLTVPS